MPRYLTTLLGLISLAICSGRIIDIVTPVAGKDATVYRFNLRHALKHVQGLRNVYVVCRPSQQMRAVAAEANARFVGPGQKVVLVDEAVFPFSFDSIRQFLREATI